MEKTKIELPKWFNGTVYDTGDAVSNPFTGDSIDLTAEELSMYDLIMGCQVTRNYKLMQRCLDWFRRANPEAYMVLLD